ncbi:hypothetical protein K432DRAFT_389178 [Lepidopterella palustris CBS 459.81]|uniref:Zn(2)-C6 fungal-type domain-containing protein n=1 Tax=Lepidopterella palustris CBS 459.81 TaxID=1314670 RepID=A0A8E2EJ29_9PEZI|nr:hypothetical protein K432DRAFT_389178 [Lepidopterella palustris CBS 459.81]
MASHVSSSGQIPITPGEDSSWWIPESSAIPTRSIGVNGDGNLASSDGAVNESQVTTPRIPSGATANRASVPVACVACRSRHLKCDGGIRCSRCKVDGVECSYVKSRRGWKGKRRNKESLGMPPGPLPGNDNTSAENYLQNRSFNTSLGQENISLLRSPLESALRLNSSQASSPAFDFNSDGALIDAISSASNGLNFLATAPINHMSLSSTSMHNSLQPNPGPASTTGAFFVFFYSSHPFLLPRNRMVELLKERRIPHLELAIQYIGSCFLPTAPTDVFRDALSRMLSHQNLPKDGFSVQALLLFAIGINANNEPAKAAQMLQMAINMALEIGLNRAEFALIHGHGDRVMEECWKRTWWSLFVINGLFAAVNPSIPFRLRDVVTDVPLPCEENEYLSGHIPFSRSVQEYDDSSFSNEDVVFSSFTYLVDAVRILGKVLEVSRADSLEYHKVDVADAYLVNWSLHLPPSKREIVSGDGRVDEILFQAHMVISGSTIMLHRPRSNLGFGDVEEVTTCVTPGQCLLPTQPREIHTAKCLHAAEDISKLITLPTSLQKHTPFFTCVIVMASVVHLSYWSFLVPDGQDENIKSLIRLDTGSLQSLSALWPVANTVLHQVRGVAHIMFNSKKAMSIHMWSSIANDDIIRDMIEEGSSEDPETYSQLLTP